MPEGDFETARGKNKERRWDGMMNLTELERVCYGAKLVCTVCGASCNLELDRMGVYISHGWPVCCGMTMRLVTKAEQEVEE